jgi:predicted permease
LIRAIRFSLRGLWRRPGLTAVTTLTLGVGIGSTTTILSVVDGVMLRPLPYENGERLAAVGVTFPGREWVEGVEGLQHLAGVSHPNFAYLRDRVRTVEDLSAVHVASALLPDEGDGPRIVPMARVTPRFFEVLGVGPELGRLFTPDEYETGNDVPPVLISWTTWRDRFGSDPGVVGRSMPAPEGLPAPVVVGVLSEDFDPPENLGLAGVGFWQPLDGSHPRYEDRGARSLDLVGRLAPGATVDAARAELTVLAAEIASEHPEGSVYPDGSWFGYGANGLREDLVGAARRPLLVFLGAASLLLLVSAMNAANLLLVRASDRVAELGLRRALGASRADLFGQIALEGVLLSIAGGILGVVVAWLGVAAFLSLSPDVPRMDQIAVDARILALAAVVSLGSGLLIGMIPAIGASRREPGTVMGTVRVVSGRASSRFRGALVTLQLGLALLLGVGASVLMHSFVNVRSVDPGFEPAGLTSFRLPLKQPGGPETTWAAWDETLAAIREVEGVVGVAGATNLPFEDPNWAPGLRFPGESEVDLRTGIPGYAVTPGYFETVGQTLESGRAFETTDGPDAAPVAIVNRALAERDFRGRDVVGATIHLAGAADAPAVRVVGVVEDAVIRRAEEGPLPAIYVPYTQVEWPWIEVVVRSDRVFGALASDLRRAAAAVSPIVPVQSLERVRNRIDSVEREPRFQAFLIATFALAALLLAAVGLYGTLAYAVGRRRREIGIRLALGARPATVFALVLRHGVTVSGSGALLGLAGAAALGGVLERFLFQVPTLDPLAFAAGLLGLSLATLLAVLPPALKATRVDLTTSLAAE